MQSVLEREIARLACKTLYGCRFVRLSLRLIRLKRPVNLECVTCLDYLLRNIVLKKGFLMVTSQLRHSKKLNQIIKVQVSSRAFHEQVFFFCRTVLLSVETQAYMRLVVKPVYPSGYDNR